MIHAFWKAGFAAIRSAGSGSMYYPSPDIFAAKGNKRYAIECKATKSPSKYIEKREVIELIGFARVIDAIPYVAVKFNRKPWVFIEAHCLEETEKSYLVNEEVMQKKGRGFEQLVQAD